MEILELKKKRDELLKEMKQSKSEEYKKGYFDGALDIYNIAFTILNNKDKQK